MAASTVLLGAVFAIGSLVTQSSKSTCRVMQESHSQLEVKSIQELQADADWLSKRCTRKVYPRDKLREKATEIDSLILEKQREDQFLIRE